MDKRVGGALVGIGIVGAAWLALGKEPDAARRQTPPASGWPRVASAPDATSPGGGEGGTSVGQGLGPPSAAGNALAEDLEPLLQAWEAVQPQWAGARCEPRPCVASLSYADNGEQSAAFRDAVYARFLEIGAGAQPSLVLEDPKAGRQRMWVILVPNVESAAESDALMKQAAAHILADHGPDVR